MEQKKYKLGRPKNPKVARPRGGVIFLDESNLRDVLSWNLRRRMHDLDLSQQQFSQLLGVSREQVARWLNGTSWPEGKSIASICNVLQCTPDWLMKDHYAS